MSDLIDRNAFAKRVLPLCTYPESLKKMLDKEPTVDAEPVRHGRWIECDWVEPDGHGFGTIRIRNAALKCSECNNAFKKDLLWKRNYCNNCGAKMDLEEATDVDRLINVDAAN